ncbi:hypothetical protein [Aureliella helgolandensis]|uniref:Membrane or secreted protein n=1 Tax=Aureliella helgolandensis TaxID=2527968 RepID=A0A518GF31_9BACT|nr:hypothetical protein [Aureliella helgolandensis]QDV27158.1 hypothetical protein Q31a_55450 [Aureliella helgolandensis]
MPRMLALGVLFCFTAGCASRPGWGWGGMQGTTDRQKARAVIHDPYPLNDIGPEVIGGRPREFYTPQAEAHRTHNVDATFPQSFGFPPPN